jgi:integrase
MAEVAKFPTNDHPSTSSGSKNSPATRESKGENRRVGLTEARIEKLSVTGKTYYVQDGAQSGLSVRVSAGGVKAFIFTKHKHGQLTRITLGRAGAMRLDAARRAVQGLHGELAMGVDVGAKRKAAVAIRASSETMQEAFERFLTLKARRASTVGDYQSIWRLHIPASLKRKAVRDVTPQDVEDVKRKAGELHRTANLTVTLIGAVMAKSGRWADNPTRGVSKHHEQVRTRRLSIDELRRLWNAMEALDLGQDRQWGDFFRLLILTGSRRSPFCAMRWRDLDLDARVWMVPVEWAKSKREMAVPLSSEAVWILTARREQAHTLGSSDWVWPSSESATGHVVNPEKPWRRLLKAAGVKEHTTLHDIRRTLGSRLAMDGVAGATISKVLGHVSPQSLRAYVHLDVAAGGEAIDRVMAGILKPYSKE